MRKTTRRILAATATSAAVGMTALAPVTTAGAAPEAPSLTAKAIASETEAIEPQASWQYYDWYYFKADCQDWGQFLANEPIADDYDYWKCVYRGTWPTDYYDLYVK